MGKGAFWLVRRKNFVKMEEKNYSHPFLQQKSILWENTLLSCQFLIFWGNDKKLHKTILSWTFFSKNEIFRKNQSAIMLVFSIFLVKNQPKNHLSSAKKVSNFTILLHCQIEVVTFFFRQNHDALVGGRGAFW